MKGLAAIPPGINLLMILVMNFVTPGVHAQVAQTEWQYPAISKKFWSEVEGALAGGNPELLISMGSAKFKTGRKEALETAEAQLAMGIGLARTGMAYGATVLLGDLIKSHKGTAVADRALLELEDIAKRAPILDDSLLGELVFDPDISFSAPTLRDFVSYQNAIFNYRKGFSSWSKQDFKNLSQNSYWRFQYKYFVALLDVQKNRIDSALEVFASLANEPAVPAGLRMDALHQYARLLFERGDYNAAYKSYSAVDLNPRERGMILLERAWTKYYLRDYAKALGLLVALEAPIYDTARSPEVYVLKMLIFKELCLYESVFGVQKEFLARFEKSIEAIRKRSDLRRDPMIVNLAVLDRRYSDSVMLLNQIKEERRNLPVGFLKGTVFFAQLNRQYQLKANEIRARLDVSLESKTREIADQLLDWQEQISFIDYQTRVDSLRVTRPSGEVYFKSEGVTHMSFDKIYWLFNGEFWRDELEDLVVQVESKCPSVIKESR